jgi:hypothetical protein
VKPAIHAGFSVSVPSPVSPGFPPFYQEFPYAIHYNFLSKFASELDRILSQQRIPDIAFGQAKTELHSGSASRLSSKTGIPRNAVNVAALRSLNDAIENQFNLVLDLLKDDTYRYLLISGAIHNPGSRKAHLGSAKLLTGPGTG